MNVIALIERYWPYVALVVLAIVLIKSMGVVAALTVLVIGYFVISYTRRSRDDDEPTDE